MRGGGGGERERGGGGMWGGESFQAKQSFEDQENKHIFASTPTSFHNPIFLIATKRPHYLSDIPLT